MTDNETVWTIALKSLAIDTAHGMLVSLLAGVAFTLMLRFMDWTAGGSRLKSHMALIECNAIALSNYRGHRMIATGLLMGLAWLAAK